MYVHFTGTIIRQNYKLTHNVLRKIKNKLYIKIISKINTRIINKNVTEM
jgi:hypothetical protein